MMGDQQQFPWQRQSPQQGWVPPQSQQQFQTPFPSHNGQGQGYGGNSGPAQAQQQSPSYPPSQGQVPPWMMPKMPSKGNPSKKKKALWYVLVVTAIVTGIVFLGTAIYYFMKY